MNEKEFNENQKGNPSPKTDRWIREELRNYPVWEIDSHPYVQRMMDALNPPNSHERNKKAKITWPVLRLDWGLGISMGLAVMVFCIVLWTPIHSKPVSDSIQWISINSNQSVAAPHSWKTQLDAGKTVYIPSDVKARIHLVDGSALACSPNTALAVNYQATRQIDLISGSIEVDAARMPDKPMYVRTPLNTLKVIGTKFTVELLSKTTKKENES